MPSAAAIARRARWRGERVVAAEVARRAARRELAPARPFEHDARRERFDRARDDLERARFVGFVGVDAHRFGTARFGFPPAHPARHTLGTRSAEAARTRSRLPIAFAHDNRTPRNARRADARGDHRPVGTPDAAGARHPITRARCPAQPFASTSTSRSRATSSPLPAPSPATCRRVRARATLPRPATAERDEHRGRSRARARSRRASPAATRRGSRRRRARRRRAARRRPSPTDRAARGARPRTVRARRPPRRGRAHRTCRRGRRPPPTRRRRWRPRRAVNATVVDPRPDGPSSATVLPRRTPPAGKIAPREPATVSRRSPASTAGEARVAADRGHRGTRVSTGCEHVRKLVVGKRRLWGKGSGAHAPTIPNTCSPPASGSRLRGRAKPTGSVAQRRDAYWTLEGTSGSLPRASNDQPASSP